MLTFQPGRTTEWIAVTVNGAEEDNTTRQFLVGFTPVKGSATTVTATVTTEPLRVLSFNQLIQGLFYIQFPTGKGQNYIIQEAQTLAGPWTVSV